MDFSKWGPATVLVVAIAVIIVLVGGVVCITNPDTLSFDAYLKALIGAIVGTGLLGIGRGHAAASQIAADAIVQPAPPLDPEGVKASGLPS